MHKKKIALAVIATLAAPWTIAQNTSNVSVYGRLNVDVETVRTSGATSIVPAIRAAQVPASAYTGTNLDSTGRMTSNSSAIGFKGTEKLGEGLTAWFQIESGLNVDTGAGSIASRNTAVGLKGAWGDVLLGQWDTPYKVVSLPFGFFKGVTNADYANLISNAGFLTPATTTRSGPDGSAADAAFDRRQGNSVQYWSPQFAGFSYRIAYSLPENKTDGRIPQVASDIISASLGYKTGPLEFRYGYERHNDYFGLKTMGGTAASLTNRSSKDQGHKLAAFYTVGDTVLRAVGERLIFNNADTVTGNVNEYRRDAYLASVEQKIGAGEFWGAYGTTGSVRCELAGGAACNSDGLGGTQLSLAYKYNMSKRTFGYLFYTRMKNDESARYSIAYPLAATAPGATTTALALGINHDF
jgi:predicted porin